MTTTLHVQEMQRPPGEQLARDLTNSPIAGGHHVVERTESGAFVRILASYVSAEVAHTIVGAIADQHGTAIG